jgi:hypothetical protein
MGGGHPEDEKKSRFEELDDQQPMGFLQEFFYFLVVYRNWWLIPVFAVLALLGLFILLGGSGAAPFIYTIF